MPNSRGLTVGSQFSLTQSSTVNDTTCATAKVAPRLTFPAHMAPLDLLFEPDGSAAYVSFHGSCKCLKIHEIYRTRHIANT